MQEAGLFYSVQKRAMKNIANSPHVVFICTLFLFEKEVLFDILNNCSIPPKTVKFYLLSPFSINS